MNNLRDIVNCHDVRLKKLKPSEFAEQYRMMPPGGPLPGHYSFKNSPYTREISDKFSPDDPTKMISIIKVPQSGLSVALVENCLCWSISESPGNWMILSADGGTSKKMVDTRIDPAIKSCGIEHKIKPSTERGKNQRTGNTSAGKEFYGGSVIFGGPNNPTMYRQHTLRYGILDDFDAAKIEDATEGNVRSLFLKRFTWHQHDMKAAFISTPTISGMSNIEDSFNMSDKREYNVPCPCCGSFIVLEFQIKKGDEKFGLKFKLDRFDKVNPKSVEYRCQECGEHFTDSHKYEILNSGIWVPTNEEGAEPYHAGYHIGGLILPAGTISWYDIASDFVKCYPNGLDNPVDPAKLKVFKNQCEGWCYSPKKQKVSSSQLQKNIRDYAIGTIPAVESREDGNGEILYLQFVSDINGNEDDCRMDYEIIAYTESQANYSIDHGSIGSFQRRTARDGATAKTVRINDRNSIWTEVSKILSTGYPTTDGRTMYIKAGAIDEGFGSLYVQEYINALPVRLWFMFKGVGELKSIAQEKDLKYWQDSPSHARRKNVLVNIIKDDLYMVTKKVWDRHTSQSPNFMNFPKPTKEKYTYEAYFKEYEGEHKVVTASKNGELSYIWQKKTSESRNHFWDCRVYDLALADILMRSVCAEHKEEPLWMNFAAIIKYLNNGY